jgi:hypothetical protein
LPEGFHTTTSPHTAAPSRSGPHRTGK